MSLAEIEDLHASAWADGFRRERRQTVSEWAQAHRVLSSVSSRTQGGWQNSKTPYLVEIMDNLSPQSRVEQVVFMKGGQIGGTECGNNWLGYVVHKNPGPMLMVLPTVDVARRISKQRLKPMIESTPVLRERISEARTRDSGNTVQMKEFPGGLLMVTGANSSAGLRSMPIRDLFCDEVDDYPGDVDGQGDPIALALERTATFTGISKCYLVSTPTIRGTSRIETLYLQSDQRRYHIPCPHCGHMDYLTWTGRDWRGSSSGSHHWIEFKENDPKTTRMVCGNVDCAARIPERFKAQMLAAGKWIATAKGDGRSVGYHLSALYSPPGWRSWERIADQFLKAKDDPSKLKAWVNMALGETWEERGDSVEVEVLRDRANREVYAKNTVPDGVGVIGMSCDVQGDRLEVLFKGYGAGEESWHLGWEPLHGDPAQPDVFYDLDRVKRREFRHATSGKIMQAEFLAIDAAYQTEQVYKYVRTRRDARLRYGRLRTFAVRGGASVSRPLVERPSRNNPYRLPLYVLCVNTGKDTVMSRLAIREAGPGFIHHPPWVDDEFLEQLTAERAVRKYEKGLGVVRRWEKVKARNEGLDLEVYALAGLRIFGEDFIGGLGERAARFAAMPPDPEREQEPEDAPTLREPGGTLPRRKQSGWVNRWND